MGLKDLFGLTKPEPTPIGDLILMISKRAERLDPKQQADTFVSLGGVEKALPTQTTELFSVAEGQAKRISYPSWPTRLGRSERPLFNLTFAQWALVAISTPTPIRRVRVRFENHGWAFLRMRLPPMATRIMAWETSMRFS